VSEATLSKAFEEALVALLGKDAGGLSASTIGRLKEAWSEEHRRWSKRDLSAKRYVYFWVDGIHVQARLEADAQCLLVIIGATPEGKKELVGLTDGVRESTRSWKELLLDLKRRGLSMGPELAVVGRCCRRCCTKSLSSCPTAESRRASATCTCSAAIPSR
jgi:putative transposase